MDDRRVQLTVSVVYLDVGGARHLVEVVHLDLTGVIRALCGVEQVSAVVQWIGSVRLAAVFRLRHF